MDRLSLALASARVAKQFIVTRDGIGEDLPLTLVGWYGDTPSIVLQAHGDTNTDGGVRLKHTATAAQILRDSWGVDGYTAVTEGYTADEDFEPEDKTLAWWFANRSPHVHECLTFAHMDVEYGPVFLTAIYRYDVGRKVLWGKTEAFRFPGHHFLTIFERELAREAADVPGYRGDVNNTIAAVTQLTKLGFEIVSDT